MGAFRCGSLYLRLGFVAFTVPALFPLAFHGGPLWQPLCYAQIGGLLVATLITKLQVPCMYAIFVLDLKLLKWETKPDTPATGTTAGTLEVAR